MNVVKRNSSIIVLTAIVLLWAGSSAAAKLDFAVIQPGQPGTPRDAQPVMDSLAAYLQKRMAPGASIQGVYFNDLDQAVAHLKSGLPTWGIVSLGFYVQYASRFSMIPLASTLPGGSSTDVWRLAVAKGGPDDWKGLKGDVEGTMLFETKAAACILFGEPAAALPFALTGSFRPLRVLRKVAAGKTAGIVLDRLQYEAMKSLPLAGKVKVILSTKEIPTSPVVSFGPPDKEMKQLTYILQAMGSDPEAASLLQLLQTDGFGPPDPDLPAMKLKEGGGCPR
jgi:hypothetical protein